MKCPKCGFENKKGGKLCDKCGNNLPVLTDRLKVDKKRTMKGLKLGSAVIISVLIFGIIFVLLCGLWFTLAIIFSVIFEVSLRSPFCWLIGGILPGLILYFSLSQKIEHRINILK